MSGGDKLLATRIAEYQPQAIVSLLVGIKPYVEAAADMAGNSAPRCVVLFPGMGQQNRFVAAMGSIIPRLPNSEAES